MIAYGMSFKYEYSKKWTEFIKAFDGYVRGPCHFIILWYCAVVTGADRYGRSSLHQSTTPVFPVD